VGPQGKFFELWSKICRALRIFIAKKNYFWPETGIGEGLSEALGAMQNAVRLII